MDRQAVLDFLRLVLIAFVIAIVINFFRIAIFTDWNNEPRFENITQPEPDPVQVQNDRIETQNRSNEPKINLDLPNKPITIFLTPMENLSGLSKSRILEKRIEAMRTSPIFSQMDYSPSSDVYKITDGLPWISADAALHWSKSTTIDEKINGVSRDSIGILNPELLYFVSISENEDVITDNFKPLYKDFYFTPSIVFYDPNTNTINVHISNEIIEGGNYQPICLADSNAHDLGYKYAYMDRTENVGFYTDNEYSNNRLDKDIKETTGYYMHGSVCGVPGGCNNYAPNWQYYNYFYLKKLPAVVHIKLWKQRPQDVNQEADINYQMVFKQLNKN